MKLKHSGKKIIKYTNSAPSVVVSLEAYNKMNCYIDLCDKEVGWLGTAYKVGNEIRIKDVFLFEQEVHATTCELTPGGITDFVMDLYNTMHSDDAMEISNNLTCWGHSHVRMGVSPSHQDDMQLRSFSTSGHEWFIRIIGNKLGAFEYTYIDYNTGIEIKDLDWKIDIPGLDLNELKMEIKEEVKTKVKTKQVYTPWESYPGVVNGNRGVGRTNYDSYFTNSNDNAILLKSTTKQNDANSLLDDDYFNSYIRQTMEDEEDILAEMEASANHEIIMNIVGNDCDSVSDEEYQILDEALCQLTLDDLAYIGNCEVSIQATGYIQKVSDDYFVPAERDELYQICKTYIKSKLDIGGIVNENMDIIDRSSIGYISGIRVEENSKPKAKMKTRTKTKSKMKSKTNKER